LKKIFEQWGKLEKVYLKTTPKIEGETDNGQSSIYGFVTFMKFEETENCLRNRDKIFINEKKISVLSHVQFSKKMETREKKKIKNSSSSKK